MKKTFLSALTLFFMVIFFSNVITSCYYDNEETLYPTGSSGTCDTTVYTFSGFASPLILNSCGTSGCHSASSQSAGVTLSSYTTIKNYITSNKTRFLGSIKHQSGYSAMPQGTSKLSDCNITKLELWITAGMPNN